MTGRVKGGGVICSVDSAASLLDPSWPTLAETFVTVQEYMNIKQGQHNSSGTVLNGIKN